MRIGRYTLEQSPSPGWTPPLVRPRISQAATVGGARVTVLPGHISDEDIRVPFDWLDASPARALLQSDASQGADGDSIGPGERMGMFVPSTSFAAVSAARISLRASPALQGYLTLELWCDSPRERTGLIGVIMPADLSAAYQTITRWSLTAWPVGGGAGSTQSWLVVNGDHMTGGVVYWQGETTTPNGHVHYTSPDWITEPGRLWHEVYQGGQYCILRGLVEDEAAVPASYDIDFGWGGNLYVARLAGLSGEVHLNPQSYDEPGLVRDAELGLIIESAK
jgi:hypothetical protein